MFLEDTKVDGLNEGRISIRVNQDDWDTSQNEI